MSTSFLVIPGGSHLLPIHRPRTLAQFRGATGKPWGRGLDKADQECGKLAFMATERFPGGLRMYQNYDQERWGRIDFSKLRACPQARAPHPNAGVADLRGGGRVGWMRPEGGTNRILIYRGSPEVSALPQS